MLILTHSKLIMLTQKFKSNDYLVKIETLNKLCLYATF